MEKNWYAVHTYAGHENKVKTTIERRAESMNLTDKIFRILIPTSKSYAPVMVRRERYRGRYFPATY